MNISLQQAQIAQIDEVLEYVRAYHEYEAVQMDDESRREAIRPLLGESGFGRIWLITLDTTVIGYIAVCFGYSIEFGGPDAFIDEMFISPGYRGKGYGQAALRSLRPEARRLGVRALHLEVARTNGRAQHLYESVGFEMRDKYMLMSAVFDGTNVEGVLEGQSPTS